MREFFESVTKTIRVVHRVSGIKTHSDLTSTRYPPNTKIIFTEVGLYVDFLLCAEILNSRAYVVSVGYISTYNLNKKVLNNVFAVEKSLM